MTDTTTIRRTAEATPADFAHVRDWVFDLDNTLYPRKTNLFAQIDSRMTKFVGDLLSLDPVDRKSVV